MEDNPMDIIDTGKPLLIMIKSIITIGLEDFPHPALHCCSLRRKLVQVVVNPWFR
jgi:hypothetical protein